MVDAWPSYSGSGIDAVQEWRTGAFAPSAAAAYPVTGLRDSSHCS